MRNIIDAVFTLPLVRRYFSRRIKDTIMVLAYHYVVRDPCSFHSWFIVRESNFIDQLEYLKNKCHVVSLDEALAYSETSDSNRLKVVLTFDDGLRNNYHSVYPLLKKFQFPATFYVATEAIQSRNIYWWNKVLHSIQVSKVSLLDLKDLGLGRYRFNSHWETRSNWLQLRLLLEDLKKFPYSLREEKVTAIEKILNCHLVKIDPIFEPMEIADIKEMATSKLMTIGAHTHCHNLLDQLSLEEVAETINKSKKLLEKWTDCPVEHFAYPNGIYNEEILSIVKQYGFKSAVTTALGRIRAHTNVYEIPRIGISAFDGLSLFKSKVFGVRDFLHSKRQAINENHK